MKLLFLICILPVILTAKSNFEILAGTSEIDGFDRGSAYSINYSRLDQSNLGFNVGIMLSQETKGSNSYTQLTLPQVGIIRYFKLNRTPFNIYLGAGFGLVHLAPSNLGENYIKTYLNAGVQYKLSTFNYLFGQYTAHYGKTISSNQTTHFDGSVISLGIGFNLRYKKKKQPQTGYQTNTPRRKQRRNNNRPSSTYQQSQKLMNDLSWPTY